VIVKSEPLGERHGASIKAHWPFLKQRDATGITRPRAQFELLVYGRAARLNGAPPSVIVQLESPKCWTGESLGFWKRVGLLSTAFWLHCNGLEKR